MHNSGLINWPKMFRSHSVCVRILLRTFIQLCEQSEIFQFLDYRSFFLRIEASVFVQNICRISQNRIVFFKGGLDFGYCEWKKKGNKRQSPTQRKKRNKYSFEFICFRIEDRTIGDEYKYWDILCWRYHCYTECGLKCIGLNLIKKGKSTGNFVQEMCGSVREHVPIQIHSQWPLTWWVVLRSNFVITNNSVDDSTFAR